MSFRHPSLLACLGCFASLGVSMKRWLVVALALIVIAASLLLVRIRLISPGSKATEIRSHLIRVPNSAYKYHLCVEALAFKLATPDNPYKTDETFHDPFRHTDDTIIPRFLGFERNGDTVSFSVKIIFNQIATYNETISHVRAQDGISILIPDNQNNLQHSSIPQFIISNLPTAGRAEIAVIDYTCPEQWKWSVMQT